AKMSVNVSREENADNKLQTLVHEMGYSLEEARKALQCTDNNLELAVQYLLEGDAALDGADISYDAAQRRNRRNFKQLRHHLMGDPALNERNIEAMMKKTRTAEVLREMVSNHSVQFLSTLLESSSDEEHEETESNE
ncbi:hypothetical protein KR093_005876, partial [Drosophila rubida]